ncbi:unnamed protein product [Ilex paraguariensis]|uniref:Uncharacterized protein n=1 Tax=Ilex paraguariensis TaxID=185542 RepID=A0ABC8USI5_9AQUA
MELCEVREFFAQIISRGQYTERAAAVVTHTIVEVIQEWLSKPEEISATLQFVDICKSSKKKTHYFLRKERKTFDTSIFSLFFSW